MNIFEIPSIPLDPPPFIIQYDYPIDDGVEMLERKLNESGRLKDRYEGRGPSVTFVISLLGKEITVTSINEGFIYDKFFGPYGGDLDFLPRFFTDILRNLENTQDKTSLYVELPEDMDMKNQELLIQHLASVLGGFCDYLPRCSNYQPLNSKTDKNRYIKQAKDHDTALAKLDELILTGKEPA